MIPLPSPLHPAVVHFPIVLLLLGAPVAILAAIFRRWHLPLLACLMLVGGALGSLVAVGTGEAESAVVGELPGAGEQVLEEHEEMAETTRNLAIVGALLAIASVLLTRFPLPGRILGGLAAVVAVVAAFTVAQTGHLGGQLVYKHGAGVNLLAGQAATPTNGEGGYLSEGGNAERGHGKKKHDDDDD